MGYFDGEDQWEDNKCGVGALIFLDRDRSLQINWNCGGGTNTQVSCWPFGICYGWKKNYYIKDMIVLRDSKTIVDWISNNCCLQVLVLEEWKRKVKNLLDVFNKI